ARAGQLRRETLERRDGTLGGGGHPRRPLAFVGSERLGRGSRTLRKLGDVAETLALVAQALFRLQCHSFRVFDERSQAREPCDLRVRPGLKLLVPLPPRRQLAPGEPCASAPPQPPD